MLKLAKSSIRPSFVDTGKVSKGQSSRLNFKELLPDVVFVAKKLWLSNGMWLNIRKGRERNFKLFPNECSILQKKKQETLRLFWFNRRCFVAVVRPKIAIHQSKNKNQPNGDAKRVRHHNNFWKILVLKAVNHPANFGGLQSLKLNYNFWYFLF